MPIGRFDDLLLANSRYAETFALAGIPAPAARGLAVVTCIDSRIEPLAMLGLQPGDAKILRNAGARVTPDVLRTLIAAVHFLNVSRIALVGHTDCAMSRLNDEEFRAALREKTNSDAVDDLEPMTVSNQHEVFASDAALILSHPLIGDRVEVAAFVYDVGSGLLKPVD
jgi:carbonic anhydrase